MRPTGCRLCGGACAGSELDRLLQPELRWLWEAVAAAADRRGTPEMTDGSLSVTAPADSSHRAAAAGLLARIPQPGKTVRINLVDLTDKIRVRGDSLTPGAVAAHAVGRELSVRVAQRNARRSRAQSVSDALVESADRHPELAGMGTELFDHLRKSSWVARLDSHENPTQLISDAVDIAGSILRIPDGEKVDRRMLVPHHPHALDEGTPLAGVVLSVLALSGKVASDRSVGTRALWAQAGVDCDNIVGGLAVVGIHPRGWALPVGAVCTLPPRELVSVEWPTGDGWVFVTENPSILAAAADTITAGHPGAVRLICTVGNPSAVEISALSKLADSGWRVAVRADFDPSGLRTVGAILNTASGAVPWRMGTADYLASNPCVSLGKDPMPATPWDPRLAETITETGCSAYEEVLTEQLLADLRRGYPQPIQCDSVTPTA